MFFKKRNIFIEAYDNYLLNLMENKSVKSVSRHTITFEEGEQIWLSDGSPYCPIKIKIRPSKKVLQKFYKFAGQKFLEGLADKSLLEEMDNLYYKDIR